MGSKIFGFCENKGKHKLDTVKVSATQPTTNDEVWIKKGKNILNITQNRKDAKEQFSNIVRGNIEIVEGETYTVSFNTTNNGGRVYVHESLFTYGSAICDGTRKYLTVKGRKTGKFNNGMILTAEQTVSTPYDLSDIQIELNSYATPYEEYINPAICVKNNNIYEDLNFITKGNFAVITGSMQIDGKLEGETDWVTQNVHLDFPTGFTKDNCVVVAFGTKANTNIGYNYGHLSEKENASAAMLYGAGPKSVTLGGLNTSENKIIVHGSNYTYEEKTLYYKIILMKV